MEKHKNYFEATIQLRPYKIEVDSWIEKQINKREDVFISRKVKVKGGIDIYLSSQRFARALGNKLKKAFKGELKMSRTLFTQNRMTSKRVYRVTVLFRLKEEENFNDDAENN